MKKIIIEFVFLITFFGVACSSDPTEPEIIISEVHWLATSGSNQLFITTQGGLCQSPDNGDTWKIVNRDFTGIVAVSPSGTIYCRKTKSIDINHHDEWLYRSTDNGKTFLTTGWIKKNVSVGMLRLAFNKQEHLFCEAFLGVPQIWRSTSLGVSWEELSFGNAELIAPNNIFITADGVYRSEDNGDSWTKVLQLKSSGDTSYVHGPLTYNSQGRIFVAVKVYISYSPNFGLVYHSDDDGNTWIRSDVTSSFITHLATNSEDKIFAITVLNEVYRSEDNGIQWNKVNVNSFEHAFQFVINSNNNLFIKDSYDKLYRSQDNGVTWELIQPHL